MKLFIFIITMCICSCTHAQIHVGAAGNSGGNAEFSGGYRTAGITITGGYILPVIKAYEPRIRYLRLGYEFKLNDWTIVPGAGISYHKYSQHAKANSAISLENSSKMIFSAEIGYNIDDLCLYAIGTYTGDKAFTGIGCRVFF